MPLAKEGDVGRFISSCTLRITHVQWALFPSLQSLHPTLSLSLSWKTDVLKPCTFAQQLTSLGFHISEQSEMLMCNDLRPQGTFSQCCVHSRLSFQHFISFSWTAERSILHLTLQIMLQLPSLSAVQ